MAYPDLVVWDSHPLALGATPSQVFIDGSPQLQSPYIVHKPRMFQKLPNVPNHDGEAAEAIEYDGLPPLMPKKAEFDTVLFKNVKNIFLRVENHVQNTFSVQGKEFAIVIVRNGSISCAGTRISCSMMDLSDAHIVDLQGAILCIGLGTLY